MKRLKYIQAEIKTTADQTTRIIIRIIRDKSANKSSEQKLIQKSVADQLKEYKELLDMDIITEEEFNKKKQKILDL